MPIKKTIRAELFQAKNKEWSYRIIAGNGRITLTPGETYKLRGGARRALRQLGREATCAPKKTADDPMALHCQSSPLSIAVLQELSRENAAWNARKKPAGKAH